MSIDKMPGKVIEMQMPRDRKVLDDLRRTLRENTGLDIGVNNNGRLFVMQPELGIEHPFLNYKIFSTVSVGNDKYKISQSDEFAWVQKNFISRTFTIGVNISNLPKKMVSIFGMPTWIYRPIEDEMKDSIEHVKFKNMDISINVHAIRRIRGELSEHTWEETEL